jgi:hypothetical protein
VVECAINGLQTFGFGRGKEGATPGLEGEEEVERHLIPCRGGDQRAWGRGGASAFGLEVAASRVGRRGGGAASGASSLREGGRGRWHVARAERKKEGGQTESLLGLKSKEERNQF